ncbi:MAG TPA: diaminopimelate epimerase [Terriglobia bacterium]|nr:diaminopimelate epimerase [Terriglobia bacterium]
MKSIVVPFVKLHGLGNDWVAVPADGLHPLRVRAAEKTGFQGAPPLHAMLPEFARSICDRHTGIGADGLIVATEPESWSGQAHPKRSKRTLPKRGKMAARTRRKEEGAGEASDAAVWFFNADGSEAEMSGNGIRCAAAFLWARASQKLPFLPEKTAIEAVERLQSLRIKTISGVRSVDLVPRVGSERVFRVGMGSPILDPARIPFGSRDVSAPIINFPLRLSGGVLPVTVTSMGNPHCSVLVDTFEGPDWQTDWQTVGREIERHDLFPNRTNVEFVKVLSRKQIEVRFWERGVGVTQSSGTGSCAAVVACILNCVTGRKVRVDTVAGSLEVAWPASKSGEVTLTGPAAMIAQGTYYYGPRSSYT